MTLTIPQPEGTTHWKLGLQMDTNVQDMHVRTSDASMTILDEDTIELEPLSNNDFNAKEIKAKIEFFFDKADEWETNSEGEIPRWRFPCVTKVITCNLKVRLTYTCSFTCFGITKKSPITFVFIFENL